MSPLRRILSAPATRFAAGNGVFVGLNLIQGILFARILGPERYGVWIGLLLLYQYGQHSHLGVLNSVQRQLPLMRGRGDDVRAAEIAGAARGLLLLTSLAWMAIGSALALMFFGHALLGALCIVGITAVEVWWQLGIAELKTAHRFGSVGSLLAGRGTLNFALLPLVVWMGLHGAYLRWGILIGVLAVVTLWLDPVRGRPRLRWADLRFLVRDGGPILLVGVLFALQTSLDRTLIFLFLDDAAMGRYGVAAILMTLMLVVPGAVAQTSYPRMLEQFGRDGDASALWPAVLRRVLRVAGLTALLALVGGLAMDQVVRWVLPAYVSGVSAARWLLPGGVFLAASVPASYLLQTIRRQGRHAVVSAVSVAVQIGLGLFAVRQGFGVEGVAAATSAAFLFYAVTLLTTARASTR